METVAGLIQFHFFDETREEVMRESRIGLFFLFVYLNAGFLGNQAAASVFPTLNF